MNPTSGLICFRLFEFLRIARGLTIQYPNRTLSNAKRKTNGLIVILPIAGAAAAPDIARTVPKFSLESTSSICLVSQYPVASLPENKGEKKKESDVLPFSFSDDFGKFMAVFTSNSGREWCSVNVDSLILSS